MGSGNFLGDIGKTSINLSVVLETLAAVFHDHFMAAAIPDSHEYGSFHQSWSNEGFGRIGFFKALP